MLLNAAAALFVAEAAPSLERGLELAARSVDSGAAAARLKALAAATKRAAGA